MFLWGNLMQFRTKLDENMQRELIKVPSIFAVVISVIGLSGIILSNNC